MTIWWNSFFVQRLDPFVASHFHSNAEGLPCVCIVSSSVVFIAHICAVLRTMCAWCAQTIQHRKRSNCDVICEGLLPNGQGFRIVVLCWCHLGGSSMIKPCRNAQIFTRGARDGSLSNLLLTPSTGRAPHSNDIIHVTSIIISGYSILFQQI